MLIETLGSARDMGRLNQILGVLIRHGFGDSVRRLGLAERLERAGHALRWEHAADLAKLEPAVQPRQQRCQRRSAGHIERKGFVHMLHMYQREVTQP